MRIMRKMHLYLKTYCILSIFQYQGIILKKLTSIIYTNLVRPSKRRTGETGIDTLDPGSVSEQISVEQRRDNIVRSSRSSSNAS